MLCIIFRGTHPAWDPAVHSPPRCHSDLVNTHNDIIKMREPVLKSYKRHKGEDLLKTQAVKGSRLVGGVHLPRIRTLRVWRPRMLTAMLAGTFIITTPELSQTLAMFVKSALHRCNLRTFLSTFLRIWQMVFSKAIYSKWYVISFFYFNLRCYVFVFFHWCDDSLNVYKIKAI